MFRNSFGELVLPSSTIFPLVSFDPGKKVWQCLGTGFFIDGRGGFVTAKHVFFKNDGGHVPTLYAVQTTSDGEQVLRSIREFAPHPSADIGLGFLGPVRNNSTYTNSAPIASAFTISLKPIHIGDDIKTFAFPLTEVENTDDGSHIFSFKGKWSEGKITEYYPDGASLVKNPCYQTTMHIEQGASGGPVMRGPYIIGVNSSGYDLKEGEEPMSFITPISLIEDIIVTANGRPTEVRDIIKCGGISSEK